MDFCCFFFLELFSVYSASCIVISFEIQLSPLLFVAAFCSILFVLRLNSESFLLFFCFLFCFVFMFGNLVGGWSREDILVCFILFSWNTIRMQSIWICCRVFVLSPSIFSNLANSLCMNHTENIDWHCLIDLDFWLLTFLLFARRFSFYNRFHTLACLFFFIHCLRLSLEMFTLWLRLFFVFFSLSKNRWI